MGRSKIVISPQHLGEIVETLDRMCVAVVASALAPDCPDGLVALVIEGVAVPDAEWVNCLIEHEVEPGRAALKAEFTAYKL